MGIVDDAVVIPELAHFNSLTNASDWAEQINAVLNEPVRINREESLNRMKNSAFELRTGTQNLVNLYER